MIDEGIRDWIKLAMIYSYLNSYYGNPEGFENRILELSRVKK